MATQILRPQDCLVERIKDSPCRRRNYYGNYSFTPNNNYYNSNPRFNRKSSVRSERSSEQRKRQAEQPSVSKKPTSADDFKLPRSAGAGAGLVMEKVMILRRGESLDSMIKSTGTASDGDLVVTGTGRLGPDPEMVPKQIRMMDLWSPMAGKCDVYAGSAFAVSPAPSSLPLPSFSKKKQISIDDSATRDLRRLLRLDF